ncbi:MAG: ABC transporter permease subunit [Planctomycetaceae bacterium]
MLDFTFFLADQASGVLAPDAPPNTSGITILLLLVGIVIMMAMASLLTRAGVIARATLKEGIRNPVFILATLFISMFTIASIWIPFFAFKDETKFYIQCGLATILMGGLVIALWTSSTTVTDEIEGRTAMTLLSKPINRRQFVVGKYLGLAQLVLLYVVITGTTLFASTYYKAKYDSRESGAGSKDLFYMEDGLFSLSTNPELLEMATHTLPGLALLYFELAVITSVSVAIATRVPMMMNVVTCMTIFVIGHLTSVLVASVLADNVFLKFVARLFATVLPALEVFSLDAAIATLRPVPPEYIGYCMLYSAAYITAMMCFGFLLFEDRDLA